MSLAKLHLNLARNLPRVAAEVEEAARPSGAVAGSGASVRLARPLHPEPASEAGRDRSVLDGLLLAGLLAAVFWMGLALLLLHYR